MYSTIKTYIETLITSVNTSVTGTSNDFQEVSIGWNFDDVPNNQTDKWYKVKIESFSEDEFESSGHCTVKANLEMFFLIANNTANYGTMIDTYVRGVYKQLRAFSTQENNTSKFHIVGLSGIECTGLNNFIKDNWVAVSLTINLKCIDNS